jgi:PKD repeat protein
MIASGLKAGVYTVTVTDGNCNVTDSVNVSDTPGATAEFSANPSIISIMDDIPVSFNGSSMGNIATWQWNFGDGSADANGQFVDHQYNIIGTLL